MANYPSWTESHKHKYASSIDGAISMQNQSGKAACALRKRSPYRGGCCRRCLKIRRLHWMEQFMTSLCLGLLMTLCCQTKCNCFARASWIDPDTPQQHHTTEPLAKGDTREFRLVRGMHEKPDLLYTRMRTVGRKDWSGCSTASFSCICAHRDCGLTRAPIDYRLFADFLWFGILLCCRSSQTNSIRTDARLSMDTILAGVL
jgi:hypothetical protein